MKKLVFSLTLCSFLIAGAAQLFAGSISPEECYDIVYSCESACAIDFPSTPWQQCMEWCVPDDCHEYI